MHIRRALPLRLAIAATAVAAVVVSDARSAARAEEESEAEAGRRLRRTPVVLAVEKAAPAVVSIGTTQFVPHRYFDWDFLGIRETQREAKGLGSGVILHASGLVVTNAHVINQADQVTVRLTGVDRDAPELPATILAADAAHDLALLRIDRPGPFPTAAIGRASDLMTGETVVAIGSPYGLGRTVSTGIVSALDRTITIRDREFAGLIQTDAAINQGNSGGALLNILGEWIGVNSAIYSRSGGADGISFAIPVDTVTGFLAGAAFSGRAFGRWTGMDLTERGGEVRATTVWPVGPAADARVPQGARIVEFGGRPVRTLGDAVVAFVDALPRGKAELVWSEGGERRRAEVRIEEPPTARLAWERLGLRATEVTPQVREQTGFPVGSGILVTEVREDGAARRAGLAPGDLLLAVSDATVQTAEDLLAVVQRARRGETVSVTLVRPERTRLGVRVERRRGDVTVE